VIFNNLPGSWAIVPMSEVSDFNPKSYCLIDEANELPVHFVPMSAVTEEFGGIDVSKKRPLHEVKKGYTSFLENDVIFAKITPCMENGKLAVIPKLQDQLAFGSTEFHVLRAHGSVIPLWLAHFLSQETFRRFARQNMTGSAGQLRVSTNWLASTGIPVAPIAEQTRIVEKLEELLSDLDAGVSELKAAQKKLGQYRQSLLKAAVEGALTAQWRAQHTPTETGAQLLERILKERRARWEAKQITKFEEQGKAPPKDWRKQYREPVAPDTNNLPKLPERWTWATLDQLLASLTSGSRDWSPYYNRGKCIFVMAQNVRPWRPDLSFKQFVDPPENDRDRTRSAIQKNDLLLTIVGANTGQICRVDETLEAHFVCQSVALLRLIDPSISEYVNAALNSEGHGQRQFRELNYGAGRPHLSFDQLEAVTIPLPPLEEQIELLGQVMNGLASIEQMSSDLRRLDVLSSAQRKNILKAAFSGQLVPQDPGDEPAAVLLERIRAERAATAPAARRGRQTKMTA
jgi:type I restriction enzyme, S subunit